WRPALRGGCVEERPASPLAPRLLSLAEFPKTPIFIQTLNRATPMSKLPVLKGTLDLLVLRALSWTPMHGFEIVSWLERAANGSLDLEDSALYQAVYRLEERGHLNADWGVTANNRPARYYSITPAGRTHLTAETQSWMQYAGTVTTILTVAGQTPAATP